MTCLLLRLQTVISGLRSKGGGSNYVVAEIKSVIADEVRGKSVNRFGTNVP